MYRIVGPCYCNSGLSSEVSLSLQWSLITGFTIVYVSTVVIVKGPFLNHSCSLNTHYHTKEIIRSNDVDYEFYADDVSYT